MPEITLTKPQARAFLLAHQGLRPPFALRGKEGVLDFIRRVGCIQFDPINIVGRNPDLVLQSRIASYKPEMLEQLLYAERKLLDGWDKNMSIYGIGDWPYFRRCRKAVRRRYGSASRPTAPVLPKIRRIIRRRGPLSSLELEFDRIVERFWGPTRMARAALDNMYAWGELIVHHRVNTRKVYDFADRRLPAALISAPDPNSTARRFQEWYVQRRIGGVGLLWNRRADAWCALGGIQSKERTAALKRLIGQGRIVQAAVEGIKWPLYLRGEDRETLEQAVESGGAPPRAAILAPLDNLLWDRDLIAELFGFRYVWEVYKPAGELKFGYYVLPVLFGDRFVARFEPGREEESGNMRIKNWWWEEGVEPAEEMRREIHRCFRDFLRFLGAEGLSVDAKVRKKAGLDWLVRDS